MQDIIRLLPESLANQIAAGEVVQRPASVVKELMENSVDAGATDIIVVVKEAGKALIQVSDNGKGMSETDARLCFERHATSKISQTDDLFNIRSFGFRGEALASIAAVAQVELKTRPATQETGTRVLIEASKVTAHEPIACPAGTTLTVRNLFYNVPARRNFLKSNQVEFKHILEEFQRVALAWPEVGFSLYHEDEEVLQLKGGKLGKRIVQLFGRQYQDKMVPCQEEVQEIKIYGYAGKPEVARKTRGEQYFFVNHRFIRHPYFHHAVMAAYEGLIPEGHFPFYVICIETDPASVDVNVHPTKTEVKFEDERTIYAVIRAAMRRALTGLGVAPSIDFSFDTNFGTPDPHPSSSRPSEAERMGLEQLRKEFPGYSFASPNERANQRNWENLFPDREKSRPWEHIATATEEQLLASLPPATPPAPPQTVRLSSAASATPMVQPTASQVSALLFRGEYLLTPVKSGLMAIHYQRATERILYERLLRQSEVRAVPAQRLLFPQTLTVAPVEMALLQSAQAELLHLGFETEPFGKNAIVVRSAPADLPDSLTSATLASIIADLRAEVNPDSGERTRKIAAAVANKAAAQQPKDASAEALQALIQQLFSCQEPNYTPSGKKTAAILPAELIENQFSGA